MLTTWKKFWKVETNSLTLHPIDPENSRLGGKVTVKCLLFDVRTFTFKMKTYYGIYGDDFIQYGEFNSDSSPLEDEEMLLRLTESIEGSDDIMQKTTFRFANDSLTFSHEVNDSLVDTDLVHQVPESELLTSSQETWSEKFFYGVGNDKM